MAVTILLQFYYYYNIYGVDCAFTNRYWYIISTVLLLLLLFKNNINHTYMYVNMIESCIVTM